MANIRIDVPYTITDGSEVSFTAPCDCTAVTGLIVYHLGGSKVFTFRDAHGNDLTGIGNLFESGAIVKALLDVKNGRAYLQNADTNAYLEALFADMVKKSGDTLTGSLTVEAQPSGAQGYIIQKTVDGVEKKLLIYMSSAGLPSFAFYDGGTSVSRMVLGSTNVQFTKPVSLNSGGTGATTAEEARANLGAAPDGFGLGKVTVADITTTTQLDATRNCGFYRYNISGSKICGISFTYGSLVVYPIGMGGSVQELRPYGTNYCLRRYYHGSTWHAWELVGGVQKLLWENAKRTSSFAAQTISLDLSGYDEVLIYSCLEASTNNDYMVVSRCPVGERALAHFTWGDDNVSLHRFAKTSTTGIEFFNAFHGGAQDNASLMPYRIYGIKGVSK